MSFKYKMSNPSPVKSLTELVKDTLEKTYIFQCYRSMTILVARNKKEATEKFYLALTNKMKNMGSKFSLKKCFGTTYFQRTERFMVLDGEKRLNLTSQLDLIESPDFLSKERLEKLIELNIVKVKIMDSGDCYNSLEQDKDYESDSDSEKYTTY